MEDGNKWIYKNKEHGACVCGSVHCAMQCVRACVCVQGKRVFQWKSGVGLGCKNMKRISLDSAMSV